MKWPKERDDRALGGRNWILIGTLLVGLGVALSAYGAHGVPVYLQQADFDDVEKRILRWETAAKFHTMHGIGLMLLGLIKANIRSLGRLAELRKKPLWFDFAGGLMLVGMLLFCGLLYLSSITQFEAGFFVPLGGICLILSWLLVGLGLVFLPKSGIQEKE